MDARPAPTGSRLGIGGRPGVWSGTRPAGWTTPRALAVVGAFAGVLFFVYLGSARSITAHEAHIVQCAREMDAARDWLVPRIGGRPWLEKPPLPQWAASASGAVWGRVDAFAARFPAALAGLAGVLVFTALAARLRGPAVGAAAGFVLASSYYTVAYSRLAESDVYLWAVVVSALAVFARAHVRPANAQPAANPPGSPEPGPGWRSGTAVGFFALLGLSQLSKGPMFGAVIILAPVGLWLVLHRGRGWRWLVCPVGWVCAAAGLWWVAAVAVVHPEALDLWLYHTVGRLDAGVAFNPKPVLYYLTTLPWQLMPWTLVALPALPESFRRACREPGSADRFLWVWFGAVFVTLSAASGKHHHYLIYALPPFAVWAADALPWWRDRAAALWGKAWYRWGSVGLAAAVVAAVAATTERWAFGHRGAVAAWEVAAVGGGVILGLALASRWCARRDGVRAAAVVFALAGGCFVYFNAVWLDRTDGYREDDALFRRLDAALPPGEAVVIFHDDPARVLLELTRPAVVVKKDPEELRAACAERPGCCVVTTAAADADVRGVLRVERVDQTPRPRWKGDPRTRYVVYRTAAR